MSKFEMLRIEAREFAAAMALCDRLEALLMIDQTGTVDLEI